MNLKKSVYLLIIAAVCLCGIELRAQQVSPIAFDLEIPTKLITAGQSSLLVAEAGNGAPNTGRISLVDRTNGTRRTLVAGLPAGLNRSGGQPTPDGPSGLKLRGRTLYLTIGQGDSAIPNRRGGEVPNPSVSSPIFNSVLELTLPADYEVSAGGFTLEPADHQTLARDGRISLMNAEGKMLDIRMVANLPDYRRERSPRFPQFNVRPSNLFGIELAGDSLYVVDASFNLVYRVEISTGQTRTLIEFPAKPNPMPFGPPFSEAVPDGIRVVGNRLLVPLFIGFPFPQGVSEIQIVDMETGTGQTFISGLTSAIDILPVPVPGDKDLYFTLEFTANLLGSPPPPGRLKLYTSPTAEPLVLADNLITPSSLARDPDTGDLFVTEIFTGRLMRVAASEATGGENGAGKLSRRSK